MGLLTPLWVVPILYILTLIQLINIHFISILVALSESADGFRIFKRKKR